MYAKIAVTVSKKELSEPGFSGFPDLPGFFNPVRTIPVNPLILKIRVQTGNKVSHRRHRGKK